MNELTIEQWSVILENVRAFNEENEFGNEVEILQLDSTNEFVLCHGYEVFEEGFETEEEARYRLEEIEQEVYKLKTIQAVENKTVEELRHILESEGYHAPEQWNKYALIVAVRAMKGEQAKDYLTQGCTISYITGQQPAERLYKLINGVIHYKNNENHDWIKAYDVLEEHGGNNFIVIKY